MTTFIIIIIIIIIIIFVFLFLLKIGRKTEWWRCFGVVKRPEKITVYNLGTLYLRVWAEPSHRFDEKQSNGNFFDKFFCKVSEEEEDEWSNDAIPPGNKKLKIAKNTE